MKIIKSNKITTWLITNNNIDYLNTKNENFIEKQQFWGKNHELEIFGGDFRLRKGKKTNKWRRSNGESDIAFGTTIDDVLFIIIQLDAQ